MKALCLTTGIITSLLLFVQANIVNDVLNQQITPSCIKVNSINLVQIWSSDEPAGYTIKVLVGAEHYSADFSIVDPGSQYLHNASVCLASELIIVIIVNSELHIVN